VNLITSKSRMTQKVTTILLITIASPSPAGELPRQGGGGPPSTLEIHIDQLISLLSRLTLATEG
jgi:hypothetical protein